MRRRISVGDRIGQLVVIDVIETKAAVRQDGKRRYDNGRVRCKCDCGRTIERAIISLQPSRTRSQTTMCEECRYKATFPVDAETDAKQCIKCKHSLPLSAFETRGVRGRKRPECKSCTSDTNMARERKRYAEDSEYRAKRREMATDYRRKHPEVAVKNLAKHRERMSADAEYSARISTQRSESAKRWRAAHPDRAASSNRRKYLANVEAIKLRSREWSAKNADRFREIHRAVQQRRRTRTHGTVTVEEFNEQREVFGHRCAYCLMPVEKPQMEHVIPICRGGENTIDNVVPSCAPCNLSKGSSGPLRMINR